jgi:hypothetical protein
MDSSEYYPYAAIKFFARLDLNPIGLFLDEHSIAVDGPRQPARITHQPPDIGGKIPMRIDCNRIEEE